MKLTKTKKGEGVPVNTIAIIVTVLLVIVMLPILAGSIKSADSSIVNCTSTALPLFDEVTRLCTNQTYACKNATAHLFNATAVLCTNASGVGVYNESPFPGVSLVNGTVSNVGLTLGQESLLFAGITLIVVGAVFLLGKQIGII